MTIPPGAYSFPDLGPGTYFVQEVVPTGYVRTDGGPAYYTVNATSGQNAANNNFGNFQLVSITGRKVDDVNGDGYDATDPGLGGVMINLYQGTDAAGTPLATATTAGDGTYDFSNLAPGTYFVQEAVPAGSVQTCGVNGYVVTVGGTGAQSGATVPGNNFANFTLGSISGAKFNDVNANGVRDAGDAGLAGWTIFLDGNGNGNGSLDGGELSAVTDASGNYSISGIAPGTYTLREVNQAGWVRTLGTYPITATSGMNLTGKDFGNVKTGIDITKYVKQAVASTGGEGLTPGYWKQPQHFDTWVPTGYTPDMLFDTVFGVHNPDSPTETLLQALQTGGGGFDALGRHAVAALLNAAQPNIEYAFSVAQVIAKVQSAYANPATVETIKDQLATENERGADLSTSGGTPVSGPGFDANTAPGLIVEIGDQVVFTYLVTNPGQVPLGNVVVTDDNATPNVSTDDFHPAFVGGDTNGNGLLDVGETWQYTAGPVVVTAGQHTNIATVTGTPYNLGGSVTDSDAANWNGGADMETASLSGLVFFDCNQNGLVDRTESGISNVTVTLTGTDNLGQPVSLTTTTDINGIYSFFDLRPGTYQVTETQPAGYLQGTNSVGTVNGIVNGQLGGTDVIQAITLKSGDLGVNYNYAEISTQSCTPVALVSGMTATIGFWHNKNGQALIQGLNGGGNSTLLSTWLATTFPNLYGGASAGSANLTGFTNDRVAALFLQLFNVKGLKMDARVLATALAVYSTTQSFNRGDCTASKYGFLVSSTGTAAATYNIGSNGAAFGEADNSALTVMQILLDADSQAVKVLLNNNNTTTLRTKTNTVFDGINTKGDI